jgi:hypothetical protein
MTKDEALKLALEALEIQEFNTSEVQYTQAIAVLKALAQPEPFNPDWVSYRQGKEDGQRGWVGLTDDHIAYLYQDSTDSFDFARKVDAKLKELNYD